MFQVDYAMSEHFFMRYIFNFCRIQNYSSDAGAVAPFTLPCFEWKWRANVEGFIASFKIIWEQTKHTGRGGCSLHRAAVKPSPKNFLTYCLANSPFRFQFILAVAYAENFHGGFHSVAFVVGVRCLWRHIHVFQTNVLAKFALITHSRQNKDKFLDK